MSCSRRAPTRSRSIPRRSSGRELICELAEQLGAQAVVVAIDAEGGVVRSRAGTTDAGRTAVAWAREAEANGAGEILLTSIDADGTRDGYDLELTAAVAAAVDVPVIASGGAGEAHTSQKRSRSRRLRCLPRSCTRTPHVSARCATSCASAGWSCGRAEAGDRPGLRDGTRSDARVDERRGRTPDARDERGVVLEPVAGAAVAEGRDVGQHTRRRGASRRLRRRRDPAAGQACRTGVPHGLDNVLRARRSGARSRSARSSVRTARTPPRCSTQASARVPARWARRRSSSRSRRSTSRTNGSSRRRPTSCTTFTSCSRHAALTSHRSMRRFVCGRPADALLFEVMTRPANLVNPIKAKFARPQSG